MIYQLVVYEGEAYCDNCDKEISYESDELFHCYNNSHKDGFDLCKKCGLEQLQQLSETKDYLTRSKIRGKPEKLNEIKEDLEDLEETDEEEIYKPEQEKTMEQSKVMEQKQPQNYKNHNKHHLNNQLKKVKKKNKKLQKNKNFMQIQLLIQKNY